MIAQVDRIEARRERLLAELAGLPPRTLTAKPTDGGWSALDVVEHLVLAEESVLANMDRPERLTPRRRSLRSRFGFVAVLGVLSSPVPVTVPSRSMVPRGGRSLDELTEAWRTSHRHLRNHVTAVQAGRISGAVFEHPVSGPLTTGQALRMLDVHLRRHERQIRTLLRSLGEGAA